MSTEAHQRMCSFHFIPYSLGRGASCDSDNQTSWLESTYVDLWACLGPAMTDKRLGVKFLCTALCLVSLLVSCPAVATRLLGLPKCPQSCSKYKELVNKVHAALKTAINEAQTDTAHGMPPLREILTALGEEQEALKGFA